MTSLASPRGLTLPRHLITFMVPGRAVSWEVSRRGTKSFSLKRWQKRIHDEACFAWGIGRDPFMGRVGLSFWFMMHEARAEQNAPDLTNLVKAAEDALQGAVIGNDRRVRASHGEIIPIARGEPQRAFIEVWALPEPEPIDPADPHCYSYRPWQWQSLDGP